MLNAQQQEFFDANGYVIVEDLISPAVLQQVRDRIKQLTEEAEAGRAEKYNAVAEPGVATAKAPIRKLNELCPGDEFFQSVAKSASLLDIASELTGAAKNILLYSDQVFLKPAFCGSEKPLHQDNSYFRVSPHDFGVTCWMAIDDATIENGCMPYTPGTHKLGLIPHKSLGHSPLSPDPNKP